MTNRATQPTIAILNQSAKPICSRWAEPFKARGYNVKLIQPRLNLNAEAELEGVSGLLLPGGMSNIHPAFTGREQHAKDKSFDYALDFSAINLAKQAYKDKMPTLGICRGMQALVVAHGGKIDLLPTHEIHGRTYKSYDENLPLEKKLNAIDQRAHDIEFKPGARLTKIFQHLLDEQNRIPVNSVHNEGILLEHWNNKLDRIYEVVAICADDEVVEIISAKDGRFYVGTQAHFEIEGDLHNALYGEFFKNIDSRHGFLTQSNPRHKEKPELHLV